MRYSHSKVVIPFFFRLAMIIDGSRMKSRINQKGFRVRPIERLTNTITIGDGTGFPHVRRNGDFRNAFTVRRSLEHAGPSCRDLDIVG
jgi:hypothetical protein